MKYKVGDKVKIRHDLHEDENWCGVLIDVTKGMLKWAGKVVTISKVRDNNSYGIREDGGTYLWHETMIQGIAIPVTRIYSEAVEGEANENTDNSNTICPGYYQSTMGDIFDIANAYGLDFPLGNAVKHICRAGKKDKSKEIEDLRKAIKCIKRAIALREGK